MTKLCWIPCRRRRTRNPSTGSPIRPPPNGRFLMQIPSGAARFAIGFCSRKPQTMVLKPIILTATLLMASVAAAHPQIYTYVDANGMRHYTDVPDNNRYRLLVLSRHDRTESGDRYDS